METNRIREEFLEFVEKNKIPWGQNAKTESIIIADFFLLKIAELLKSQKESWVNEIENIRKNHKWQSVNINEVVDDIINLIK